jgi:hypothetical protein
MAVLPLEIAFDLIESEHGSTLFGRVGSGAWIRLRARIASIDVHGATPKRS